VIAHDSRDVESWHDVTDAELVFVQVDERGTPIPLSPEIAANVARAVASNPQSETSSQEST
jgi:acyl-CoA hydrolase